MDNDGITNHYNAYAQDSFRVSERLTLEFGLRFEFHPGYTDASGNIGNFDPNYAKSGAVIYPDGYAESSGHRVPSKRQRLPDSGSTTGPSLNGAPCMPVLSASQAGLPESLRTAPRRFMPRFGFAYRPFDNKTVFRGGFSVYNTEVLGSIYYALTGTLQSATYTYNNSITNGVPAIQWPNVSSRRLRCHRSSRRHRLLRDRESDQLQRPVFRTVELLHRSGSWLQHRPAPLVHRHGHSRPGLGAEPEPVLLLDHLLRGPAVKQPAVPQLGRHQHARQWRQRQL